MLQTSITIDGKSTAMDFFKRQLQLDLRIRNRQVLPGFSSRTPKT